jgi:carbonic anhydrase
LIFQKFGAIMNLTINLSAMWKCKLLLGVALAILLSFTASAASETPNISSAEALRKLEEGNQRFVEGKNTFPDINAERRRETAQNGQHPFATIISCSDSRLPVEILFDQGIGDTFVIRVAGNVCNTDEIGSAEYGAEHLGTPVLVVLGHGKCGAVTAVVKGGELPGSIPALVHGIIPAVEKAKHSHPDAQGDALVTAAIEANVWQSIEDLLKKSPLLGERVQEGKLKIVGALYDIEDGHIKLLGEHPEQSRLLETKVSVHE